MDVASTQVFGDCGLTGNIPRHMKLERATGIRPVEPFRTSNRKLFSFSKYFLGHGFGHGSRSKLVINGRNRVGSAMTTFSLYLID